MADASHSCCGSHELVHERRPPYRRGVFGGSRQLLLNQQGAASAAPGLLAVARQFSLSTAAVGDLGAAGDVVAAAVAETAAAAAAAAASAASAVGCVHSPAGGAAAGGGAPALRVLWIGLRSETRFGVPDALEAGTEGDDGRSTRRSRARALMAALGGAAAGAGLAAALALDDDGDDDDERSLIFWRSATLMPNPRLTAPASCFASLPHLPPPGELAQRRSAPAPF